MVDGVSKIKGLTDLEYLNCLGYDIKYEGIQVVYDKKEWSREFAKLLAGTLHNNYGIEVKISDGAVNEQAKYASYRLVEAAHQMSRVVYLPLVTIYLKEKGSSLQMSIYDRFYEYFAGWKEFEWEKWAAYQEYEEKKASDICKRDGMSFLCTSAKPPSFPHPVLGAVKYLNDLYGEKISSAKDEDSLSCSLSDEIKAGKDVVYYFSGPADDGGVAKKRKKEWEKLFEKYDRVGFVSVPDDGWWDVAYNNEQEVLIDFSTVKENNFAPLEIKGDLIKAKLYPKEPGGKIVEANIPIPIFHPHSFQKKTVVDLTALGMGKFLHIIRSQVHEAAARVGPDGEYGLVVTPKYPILQGLYGSQIEGLAARLAGVESEWGFEPGELAQIIYIVACLDDNSNILHTNPSTILICDGLVPDTAGQKYVVPHEFFHVLDLSRWISKKGWLFELFWWLAENPEGKDFLDYISEGNFFSLGSGGHAWKSPSEFFASLLNSINGPGWKESVFQAEDKMLKWHLISLSALRHDLEIHFGAHHKSVEKVGEAMSHIHNLMGLDIKTKEGPWTSDEIERLLKKLGRL